MMPPEIELQNFLAWCLTINFCLLTLWWFTWMFARDWMYQVHSRWFSIPREHFDSLHYLLLGTFKLSIFFFNLVPYLALRLIT